MARPESEFSMELWLTLLGDLTLVV